MSKRLIVPALDADTEVELRLQARDAAEGGAGIVKLGLSAVLDMGIWRSVGIVRSHYHPHDACVEVIVDLQKFGNDIPPISEKTVRKLKKAGADGVIVFPFAGPVTLEAICNAARECELKVIVGAHMTHPGFLQKEPDGKGYLTPSNCISIFSAAAELGVSDFVLPGNLSRELSSLIDAYRMVIEVEAPEATYWSPGLVKQGGSITDAARALGDRNFRAIVGRGAFESDDPARSIRDMQRALDAMEEEHE